MIGPDITGSICDYGDGSDAHAHAAFHHADAKEDAAGVSGGGGVLLLIAVVVILLAAVIQQFGHHACYNILNYTIVFDNRL